MFESFFVLLIQENIHILQINVAFTKIIMFTLLSDIKLYTILYN